VVACPRPQGFDKAKEGDAELSEKTGVSRYLSSRLAILILLVVGLGHNVSNIIST
jgi:hypothetical protein